METVHAGQLIRVLAAPQRPGGRGRSQGSDALAFWGTLRSRSAGWPRAALIAALDLADTSRDRRMPAGRVLLCSRTFP